MVSKFTSLYSKRCTSGLEATMAKVPSLSPDWGKFLYTTNIDKMNVNYFVKNYNEMKKIIKKIISLKKNEKFIKKNQIKKLLKIIFILLMDVHP